MKNAPLFCSDTPATAWISTWRCYARVGLRRNGVGSSRTCAVTGGKGDRPAGGVPRRSVGHAAGAGGDREEIEQFPRGGSPGISRVVMSERKPGAERKKIGRASCRERV